MTKKLTLAALVLILSESVFALPRPPLPHGPVVVVPGPVVVRPPVRRHYAPRPVYRRHYYAPAPVIVAPRPYVRRPHRHYIP